VYSEPGIYYTIAEPEQAGPSVSSAACGSMIWRNFTYAMSRIVKISVIFVSLRFFRKADGKNMVLSLFEKIK